MIVYFMATYYSQWAHENLAQRTQEQWDSFKFCRAVKNGRINGRLTFPWKHGPETIDEKTIARARWIFGLFISYALAEAELKNPILVPVPSKDGLVGAKDFRSLAMLRESIAAHGTWPICPALRFTEQLKPAHAGGPRGREAIRPFLTVSEAIPQGDVVLIDDIVTTGGSLLASFDCLSTAGRTPAAAIVCGHTVSDSLLSAFGHHQKTIDTSPQEIMF